MATRSKLNWKLLDRLLPVLEKEGWTLPMIASDWGISLSTLEGHLTQEVSIVRKTEVDWARFDELKAQGLKMTRISEAMGIPRTTLGPLAKEREKEKAHPSTPARDTMTEMVEVLPGKMTLDADTLEVHHSTPKEPELLTVHPGTPEPTEISPDEQYTQEHLATPEHSGVPPYTDDEVHPSTPEVSQELSLLHSGVPEHSSVPARQEWSAEVPAVHPGTPTDEDWELWNTIKARWLEVEKMLADRQAILSTPLPTPGHTQKKTYVFDERHIVLIDQYAQDHRLDLKDVLSQALEEFFHRRGYLKE